MVFLQCGNYGIGGFYGVHPDYNGYDERLFYDPESGINRISTVMTVLEQPSAGGATVWPYLGVAAFPEQGSGVWWYNTRTDARLDQMTQHMACPVLLGQKWSKLVERVILHQIYFSSLCPSFGQSKVS
jgi:prolyl 4-hydroxylase